jgi:hypothetical protein
MLRRSVSERSRSAARARCARSRERTKYSIRRKAVSETPTIVSAKNMTMTHDGIAGEGSGRLPSIAAETAISPTKATNQGTASRVPQKTSAPNGATSAQSATPLDSTKPPRLHWRRNGRARMSDSWLVRYGP